MGEAPAGPGGLAWATPPHPATAADRAPTSAPPPTTELGVTVLYHAHTAAHRRNLYNTALIVRLVLTWFPNPPEPIVTPLA